MNTGKIKRVYYTILSLQWFATALPLPLAVLFRQSRGLDLFQVSILAGVYSATVAVCEVPTGGLADTLGRKKVSLTAFLLMGISSIITLFAFSFPVFLAGYIIYGFSRALASGALDAWFVDELLARDPEADIQPALAHAQTFTLLALGSGTLAGGFIPDLLQRIPQNATAVLTPLSIPLALSIIILFFLAAFTGMRVRETAENPDRSQNPRGPVHGRRQEKRSGVIREAIQMTAGMRPLLLLFITASLSGFVLMGIETFWQPHFAHLLPAWTGKTAFGVIMAGTFLSGMLGSLISIPVNRKLGGREGVTAAIFEGFRVLPLLLLFFTRSPFIGTGAFWLVYLGMGGMHSPASALANRMIPGSHRSSMLSLQSMASYAGSFSASFILGFLTRSGSVSPVWLVCAAVLVLSSLLYLRVEFLYRRRHFHAVR